LILVALLVPALGDVYRSRPLSDWRSAASYLQAQARHDDFILFIPAFARIPFEYYFSGQQQRASLNPGTTIDSHRGAQFPTTVDIAMMDRIARAHPRMWIVATVPIGYEARKDIGDQLKHYWYEVEGKDFGLVYTFLWTSLAWARGRVP